MDDPLGEVSQGADGVRWFFLWRALLRYAVPVVLAVVLFFSARDSVNLLATLVSGSD
jgi:SNF family Na+-dependent transporter